MAEWDPPTERRICKKALTGHKAAFTKVVNLLKTEISVLNSNPESGTEMISNLKTKMMDQYIKISTLYELLLNTEFDLGEQEHIQGEEDLRTKLEEIKTNSP